MPRVRELDGSFDGILFRPQGECPQLFRDEGGEVGMCFGGQVEVDLGSFARFDEDGLGRVGEYAVTVGTVSGCPSGRMGCWREIMDSDSDSLSSSGVVKLDQLRSSEQVLAVRHERCIPVEAFHTHTIQHQAGERASGVAEGAPGVFTSRGTGEWTMGECLW